MRHTSSRCHNDPTGPVAMYLEYPKHRHTTGVETMQVDVVCQYPILSLRSRRRMSAWWRWHTWRAAGGSCWGPPAGGRPRGPAGGPPNGDGLGGAPHGPDAPPHPLGCSSPPPAAAGQTRHSIMVRLRSPRPLPPLKPDGSHARLEAALMLASTDARQDSPRIPLAHCKVGHAWVLRMLELPEQLLSVEN